MKNLLKKLLNPFGQTITIGEDVTIDGSITQSNGVTTIEGNIDSLDITGDDIVITKDDKRTVIEGTQINIKSVKTVRL